MLKILGNDIWRGGEKIGFIESNHVRDHNNKKLGFFEGKFVYDEDGHKIAYIEGDHLFSSTGGNARVQLEEVNEKIVGGVLPEIGKCAIYVLLGD